ncbi:MAG: di-heme oxidoredictase family protein [Burkholderiales bacterium]
MINVGRRMYVLAAFGFATWIAMADPQPADPAALTAGAFTTPESGEQAFLIPYAGLDKEQGRQFAEGHAQFNEAWVLAPARGVWGLGPTFNEDRCAHCHVNNGRASAPAEGQEVEHGMLVRLSIPGHTKEGGPLPHPSYGDQLQNRGIENRVPAEGQAIVRYREKKVVFADGDEKLLRFPELEMQNLQFGDLDPETMMSVRVAQQLVGLGLLEAVPETTMLAIAKSQAQTAFAGHPNYVWDIESERKVIGKFGWKANQPSLRQQTAAAFNGDIGATSFLFPEKNCPPIQKQCIELPSASKCGGQGGCTGNAFRPEVNPSRLTNITFYLQTLSVPARRSVANAEVLHGGSVFAALQCTGCHLPDLQTGPKAFIPAAANLIFHPYTDLLLHDMGEELADGRPDFEAGGREWRTAPLWGIGLIPTVNGSMSLLHDGRARDVIEAILWHGGQAQASQEAFRSLSKGERDALVKFVESL